MKRFKVMLQITLTYNIEVDADSEEDLTQDYLLEFIPSLNSHDDSEMDIYEIEEILEEGESDD